MSLLARLLRGHTTNVVALIATTIIALTLLNVLLLVSHSRQIAEMSQALQQNQHSSQKMQILSVLMELARKRTALTAQILNTSDPFAQDELNLALEEHAAEFARQRALFISLALLQEEQRALHAQDAIVATILPAQRRAVELAMHGDTQQRQQASELLYTTVMPGQERLIEQFVSLIRFEQHQINLSHQTAIAAKQAEAEHSRIILSLVGLALLLSTLVILRVRTIQQQAERNHEQLESEVQLRTDELNSAREMLQLVLDTIPVRVFWKDREGRYLGCNTLFAQDAGVEGVEQIIGKSDHDLAWREQAELYRRDDLAVMESGHSKLRFEEPQTTAEGHNIWLETSKIPLCDKQGTSIGILGTYYDISERKRHQQEMEHVLEQARSASQAKSEFLSSMSHELRTPLNAILGFSQLLESEESLSGDQRESVQDIIRAGSHLLELINDVLDLAKIEAGKLEVSIEEIPLDDVMNACHKLITPMAEQRGITLQLEPSCFAHHILRADYTRTKQVLLNLLSNAVKYNRTSGSVRVDCRQEVGMLRIEVHDTGPGIPANKLDKLFEAFNRLGVESSGIEGTGIGLIITRQLVRMMGGEMGVQSIEGEGSCFWFSLPWLEQRESAAAAHQATHAVTIQPSLDSRRTVLYIEDNPVNLKLVEKLIAKQSALQLLSAEEPLRGIELALSQLPDLILLDINLPEMSGYEVLQRLRQMEATRDIPVIALTANAMADDIARSKEAGFDDYLTKPIQIKRFFEVLQHYLVS